MFLSELVRRWLADERAIVAPVTALSLVILLGFSSLVVDGGLLFHQRRVLQNAADAAALAGAHELPRNPSQARVIAEDYVLINGATLEEIASVEVTTVFNPNDGLRVTLRRTVPLMLAGVIGHNKEDVTATALALVTPIQPHKLWPWGVTQESLVSGVDINLKVGARNSMVGNFMALDFPNSSGASSYRDYIKFGFNGAVPGPIPPAVWTINTETGNMAGPTVDGVDYLMHQPGCTIPWDDVRCPRVGMVPVLAAHTWSEVRGKSSVKIIGFAAFYLLGMTSDPTGQREVRGRFLHYAYGVGGQTWAGLPLSGLLGIRLWQ